MTELHTFGIAVNNFDMVDWTLKGVCNNLREASCVTLAMRMGTGENGYLSGRMYPDSGGVPSSNLFPTHLEHLGAGDSSAIHECAGTDTDQLSLLAAARLCLGLPHRPVIEKLDRLLLQPQRIPGVVS